MGRKRKIYGATAADREAAAALVDAAGRCARCEGAGGALVAVRDGAGWRAEHLDRAKCDRTVRDALREGD